LSTVNSQRFGQKYVNKVANPHDMLLWTKAPARRAREVRAHSALHVQLQLRPCVSTRHRHCRPVSLTLGAGTHLHTRARTQAGAGAGGSAAGVGYEEEGVAGALGLSTLRPEQLDQVRVAAAAARAGVVSGAGRWRDVALRMPAPAPLCRRRSSSRARVCHVVLSAAS
jgi:hypothetical protein